MYKPTYLEEFRRLNPDPRKMDAERERLAVDVLIDEKEKEMHNSPKALQYEADRKKEWRAFRTQKKQEEKIHQVKVDRAKVTAAQFLKRKMEERKKRDNHRGRNLLRKNK